MGIIEKIVTAFLKGLGIDVDKIVKELPENVGKKIKDIFTRNQGTNGSLSLEGEKELLEYFEHNKETVYDVASILLRPAKDDSLLVSYSEVINTILKIINKLGRPIVLQGFLHSAECLSYWDSSRYEGNSLKPNGDAIHIPRELNIYIIERDNVSDDDLRELNLEIRMSKGKGLSSKKYSHDKRVNRIEEFSINFGDNSSSYLLNNPTPISIPSGAPGMIKMIISLPNALKYQDIPKVEIDNSISAIRKLNPGNE